MRLTTRIRSVVLATVLAVAMVGTQAQAGLIGQSTELRMGRDAARQIESRYPVSRDSRANALVQQMGRRLAAVSSRPNLPWQFKVLEVRDVNALSVPGYVYVNRGLIDFAGSDRDALAAVIAHEVAHTAAKHAVESAEDQLKYSLALEFILRGRTARNLGTIAANLALLGYSRSDEHEADKLGVRYLRSAGYDPNGMLRFFRKLEQQQGRQPGGLATYFRTHPPTSDRIGRVQREIASLGIRPRG